MVGIGGWAEGRGLSVERRGLRVGGRLLHAWAHHGFITGSSRVHHAFNPGWAPPSAEYGSP
eukprot:4555780-Prymnesium_polylepis.2